MTFSVKDWLLATVALFVAATPVLAQVTVPTVPTAPVRGPNFRPSTASPGFRLTPAAPGLPVTTFAPYSSGALLNPLRRLGIDPFGNYGNWPLDYNPNGGYPYVYPGYYPPYPVVSAPASINANVPAAYPSMAYPSYSPTMYGSQGYGNPYLGASSTQATLSTSNGGATSIVTNGDPYTAAYANPYVPNYSPAGGFLQGAADLTTANANAAVTYQRAMLVNQQVGSNALDYRRRLWDEARHERMMLPNSEQMRLTNMQTALDRARRDPPLSEIWSGQSLNDLYNHLATQQGKGLKGPTIPLSEDVLKHINLTTGKGGNVGLLKNDIKWPNTLLRAEFDKPRKNLDTMIPKAIQEAKFGPVDRNQATDIQNNVQELHDILLLNVAEIRPSDYIQAKAYLNKLSEAARALQDPNVNNYFNDKWTAKGKTVGELVENMSRAQGLSFAAAAPGDEGAYRSLYSAMAAYDAGMTQLSAAPRQ